MLRVGLTGGIASGKSTVSAMLRDRNIPVLAADPLGHKLMEPGESAYDEVVREFGSEILAEDGSVDRGKLGTIVFADPAKRARLNWILHPKIIEAIRQWFKSLEHPGGSEFAVMEAALIYEANVQRDVNRVVVCWCTAEQQLERLMARRLTEEQARRRITAQMPVDEKKKLADLVIDCSGTIKETQQQVAEVIEKLKNAAAVK
ncbi:MAG TPA: dephospho-CoA kinase [Candidatus Acidoferrales bacterium]|jgi:dephospho-CoA kinase|nr:dephospho-CoA kinase [Candidatus Acidoferrales bacterium]